MRYAWTMRPPLAALVVPLVLALGTAPACTVRDRPPPGPGGGGTGPNGSGGDGDPDASPPDGQPVLLTGQACRIIDLRDPLGCVQFADMSGITVTIQGRAVSVDTDVDGLFSIELASSAGVVLDVRGPGFEPTVLPLRPQDGFDGVVVPVVDSTAWLDLLTALDVLIPQGTGSLAIYLYQDGFPVVGGEVVDISDSFGVFYEAGNSPLSWITASLTGASGAALAFGVNVPVTDFTAIDGVGAVTAVVDNVPVASDAITFVTVDLTP